MELLAWNYKFGSYSSIYMENLNYILPENFIAKYPLAQRNSSKLLVYDQGQVSHQTFRDLPSLLPQGLLMVFNDTRVIQSRLLFEKKTGSRIEVFCLEPYEPAEYHQAFQQTNRKHLEMPGWKCEKMEIRFSGYEG